MIELTGTRHEPGRSDFSVRRRGIGGIPIDGSEKARRRRLIRYI